MGVGYLVLGGILGASGVVHAADATTFVGLHAFLAFWTLFTAGGCYTTNWVDPVAYSSGSMGNNRALLRFAVLFFGGAALLLGIGGAVAAPATWTCSTDCSVNGIAFGLVVGGVVVAGLTSIALYLVRLWRPP